MMKQNAYKNQRNRISLLGLLCFLLIPFSGWTQYNGTGIFTKVTSLADLTDGYYVITDFSGNPAMNNSHNGTLLATTPVATSGDQLTNPDATIVWKIETNAGGRTIFNEASAQYVSYTGGSNNVQVVSAVTGDNQRWSFSYTDRFLVNNQAVTTRRLQYNAGAPRFVCYAGTQRDLALYKLTSTEVSFDCPIEEKNFGDACNDGDSNTSNDVITENCTCEGTPILVGNLCGFENFDNADLTGSYSDGSFVGNDGLTWTYVQSRDENNDANLSGIDGNAIMLRRASDNSKISSSPTTTGIGTFAAKLYKGFTGGGNRQVELFVNGESKGVSPPFDNFDEQVFIVENINIEGLVEIELRNITSTQVIVDDISWTCFGEPVVFDCPDQFANIGAPCDDGDDFTENDVLVEGCFCEGTEIESFECPDFVANIGDPCDDGDDFTINDLITADCDCVGTPIIEGEICGAESFDNLMLSGSSYVTGSFDGNNGVMWNYVSARNENGDANGSGIDGKAIMLRNSSTGSTIFSETLLTGIGSFTTKLYKGFTNNNARAVELFVNGESQGSFTMENNFIEQIFTVPDINIEGVVVIELRHIASGQIIVDDMTWTCFGEPAVFDCPSLNADIGDPCDDGDDLTENDVVLEGCSCEGTEIIFDCPLLSANFGDACNDGNPLTENATVNETCECIGTPILEGDVCGFEGFDELTVGAGYADGSFVGNDGITWTYVQSRDENGDANNSGIDGNALMLRRSSDNSSVSSSTIPGGVGSFTAKLYKGFTGAGNRQVELLINGVSQGTSVPFDNFEEQTFTVNDINIAGDIVIEVRNITGNQVIVDNFIWTCFADVTPPVALCQNLTVQLDDEGTASITADDIDNESFDDFSSVTLALDITSFTCENLGENTVELTVTDEAGNFSTCSASVTVQDTVSPTAVCQDITVQLDASGSVSILASQVDGGSSDNCGAPSLTLDQTTFDCTHIGGNVVELSVSDAAGNTSTCTALVTVLEPLVPLEAAITSSLPLTENGNVVIFDNAPAALNLASSATLTASFSPSDFVAGSYQWSFRDMPDGSFTDIDGATAATLNIEADEDSHREYQVTVVSTTGCDATAAIGVFSVDVSCKGANKVLVCHVPPGNPNNTREICVNMNAVPALMGNSDSYLGSCDLGEKDDNDYGALAQEVEVVLYPNPTRNGMFQLKYTSVEKKARFVHVYDAQGRTVKSFNVTEYPQSFVLEVVMPTLESGLYFVQVIGDDEILSKEKIMLTR